MLLSAYYMPGAVLCALFQEKEFKTCWDFSAEDKEMNEYKCTLEKFTIYQNPSGNNNYLWNLYFNSVYD